MKRRQGGYTTVEMLVTLLVSTIGFYGVLQLQVGQMRAVRGAFDHVAAMNCAQHVMESIRQEALLWLDANQSPTGAYVNATTINGGWQRVRLDQTDPNAFNGLLCGMPTGTDSMDFNTGARDEIPTQDNLPVLDRKYCVHWRLTQLNTAIPWLLRSEVRVYWPASNAFWDTISACNPGQVAALKGNGEIHLVTLSNTVIRNIHVYSLD